MPSASVMYGIGCCKVVAAHVPDDAHGMLKCVVMSDYVTLNDAAKTTLARYSR